MNPTISAPKVVDLIQGRLHKFNAAEVLAWAWNCGENCILFGPGGYGKSDAAVLFADYLRDKGLVSTPPFVLAFGQGMTEERLLGGLDIKRFQSEGEIIYNLQRAFVSSEVVIFEELWDAFPGVLLILKDILQSRMVRMGEQSYPIKTKIVIAATNRSRDEVVSDLSTAALMERFVFEREVCWTSWLPSDYEGAFRAGAGDDSDIAREVAAICAAASEGEYKISPRTAGKALKSAKYNGLQSLTGFFGLGDSARKYIATTGAQKEGRAILQALNWARIQMEAAATTSIVAGLQQINAARLQCTQARAYAWPDGLTGWENSVQATEEAAEALFRRLKAIVKGLPPGGSLAAEVIAAKDAASFPWEKLRP